MELNEFDPKSLVALILLFLSGCFTFKPPEAVVVQTPASVSTTVIQTGPAFYIYLKNDGSVWYKIDSTQNKNYQLKVTDQKKEMLEQAIASFKEKCVQENRKPFTYIVGQDKSSYSQFELAVNALKKNGLLDYHLITEQNQ